MDFSFLLCRPHMGSLITVSEAPVGDTLNEVVSVVYLCYLEDR